jgi:hypothetical protein
VTAKVHAKKKRFFFFMICFKQKYCVVYTEGARGTPLWMAPEVLEGKVNLLCVCVLCFFERLFLFFRSFLLLPMFIRLVLFCGRFSLAKSLSASFETIKSSKVRENGK